MRKSVLLLIIAALLFLIPLSTSAQTETDPQGEFDISAPQNGAQLFGLVEIIGTARHPSLFAGYTLEWSNAQNPDVWLPIQQLVTQQVTNGILGQWDTVGDSIPDGAYQLRLRGLLSNGTTQDVIVLGLTVSNSLPTSIPTAAAAIDENAPLPPLEAPAIEQPPSLTQRPTIEPLRAESSSAATSSNNGDTFMSFSSVQAAVCNGFLFSSALFGFIILYLFLRGQISPVTRRLWWQIRSELDQDR